MFFLRDLGEQHTCAHFQDLVRTLGSCPYPCMFILLCLCVCVCVGEGVGDVIVHLRLDRYCFKVVITYISVVRKEGLSWHGRQVLGMRNQYAGNSHKFISASHSCSIITRPIFLINLRGCRVVSIKAERGTRIS